MRSLLCALHHHKMQKERPSYLCLVEPWFAYSSCLLAVLFLHHWPQHRPWILYLEVAAVSAVATVVRVLYSRC